jgi:electron transfer flavoprotein alpha subunit
MTVLVIAEYQQQHLQASTLNVISAALLIDQDVQIVLVGHQLSEVAAQAASILGVTKVHVADDPIFAEPLAENITNQVLAIAKNFTHLLVAASANGKNIMPRLAALMDIAQISEITRVVSPDTFERPIYAGNAIATIQSTDAIKAITVRPTNFEPASNTGGQATIEQLTIVSEAGVSQFISRETTKLDRPELTAAKIIASGGRGLGSAEQYSAVMEPLADALGAALGASRAAVDAGYVPNDYQVGQTGKIVAPQLYVAVGISGAIQHLAGMKDSKVIVAINKDPEAPIFGVADYGLVADLFTAVPELVSAIKN